MYTKHAVLRTARNAKEIRALAATLHPDPRWPYFTWILTVNRPRCPAHAFLRVTGVPELCTTCMQPHANIPTKYLPHALPFIHLGGLPEASDKLGTLFPESGPPGTPGSCASYVGTSSLLFRDVLPRWVLRTRPTAKPGLFRSDMTFRQAMEHSGDSSKTVSFLTLWDDVIEVPPNPKLYIYQRPIPGCTCGTKGYVGSNVGSVYRVWD